MAKLAINGGEPVRKKPFPPHPAIGPEEKQAVLDVLDSNQFSMFIASPTGNFEGGPKVREFEALFANYFGVKHAVAVNSATAALHAAVVAVGVKPGQEVIVPPYTFSSTATSVLMHNAIPVFADIDPNLFCLDPESVEMSITPLTRAIIVVHLFGQLADMDAIMDIAKRHNLKVIEDCAQSLGATYKYKLSGTIADCGIFSFTQSKAIMTGEGGMLITNNDEIAKTTKLIRNHGEVMPGSEIVGWNYRMTELMAALGIAQFRKLDAINQKRAELTEQLIAGLSDIDGIKVPAVGLNYNRVWFGFALKYDESKIGIPRSKFVEALNAEGIPFNAGYVAPLYWSRIYQDRTPYAFKHYLGNITYSRGICPTTERLHKKELILTFVARPPATRDDMQDVVCAFRKVLGNIDELKD